MKYIVIYNTTTGEILCKVTPSDDSVPTNGLLVTVPDGKQLVSINPQTQEPVFENAPTDPVVDVELAIVELDARVSALEEA